MKDNEKLRSRLNELFEGESQTQIAEKLNLSQSVISKILNGKQSITIDTIYDISKLYHVSIDWLLGLSDAKEIAHLSNNITYYQAIEVLLLMKVHGSYEYKDGEIIIKDPLIRFLLNEENSFHGNAKYYIEYWKNDDLKRFKNKRLLYSAAFLDEEFMYLASELRNVDDAVNLYDEGIEAENRTTTKYSEVSPYDV